MIINRKNSTSKRILCFVIVEMLFIGGSILPCISGITLRKDTINPLSSVQLIITDDGSGNPTDMNVNVPAYTPDSGNTPVLNVTFMILGTFSSGNSSIMVMILGKTGKISLFQEISCIQLMKQPLFTLSTEIGLHI